MTTNNLDKYAALGAKAVAEGKDMTKASAGGGGDYLPPAAGLCWLRFVAYVELGKQPGTFQGKPTIKDEVQLVFELSGPKHPPTITDSGEKIPHRVTVTIPLSLNEKAHFFKLFNRMNYAGDAQHMVQLLGRAFKGKIVHRTYKGRDGKDRISAELFDKSVSSFTIEPPRYDVTDPDSGEVLETKVKVVDPAITPVKAFLWEYSDLADWANLFIPGEYPERKDEKTGLVTAPAKSKNVLQNAIKRAANFKGSPVYNLIAAANGNLDIPEAEQPDSEGEASAASEAAAAVAKAAAVPTPVGAAADDALNGIA